MKVKKLSILFTAVFLSIASILLIYNSGLGLNFTIFNLFLSLLLIFIGLYFKRFSFSFILNITFLFLLSVPFSITTSTPILITTFLAWLYMTFVSFYSLVQKNSDFEFWRYITVPVEQLITAFTGPFLALSSFKISKKPSLNKLFRVLIGIIIATPILILFTVLLLSADLAFKELFGSVFSANTLQHSIKIGIWFIAALWVIFGAFYFNLLQNDHLRSADSKKGKKKTKSRFIIESITILLLVELLFLVFNVIQITYLFGGEKMISGDKYTYSEYARKGFFELVAVSVLAFLLLGLIFKIKKASTTLEKLAIKLVGVFGILELIPMSVSAFYRLLMYEKAYGFTRLRVFSQAFILFLIVLFLWFIIKILTKLKEKTFLYGIQLITVFSILIVGLVNMDGLIAKLNIDKFYSDEFENLSSTKSISKSRWQEVETKNIDISYLNKLSLDSTSQMISFWEETEGPLKDKLAFYLYGRYQKLLFESKKRDFRQFNFTYENALKELEGIKEEIKNDSQNYTEEVINSWKIDHKNDYQSSPSLYSTCNKVYLEYLDKESDSKYFNEIDLYEYDKVTEERNFKKAEIDANNYSCLDLSSGKYFLKVYFYDDFIGSAYEVFIVKIEDDTEELFLVSRR